MTGPVSFTVACSVILPDGTSEPANLRFTADPDAEDVPTCDVGLTDAWRDTLAEAWRAWPPSAWTP